MGFVQNSKQPYLAPKRTRHYHSVVSNFDNP
uniref:Uncharacterized protein n=1 Tax=Arundo donax TaxID=35708 RepID=A0A0A9DBS8_ARUDO